MKHFIPKKTYYLKLAEIILVFTIILVGLFFYEYYGLSLFNDDNKFNTAVALRYKLRFSEKIKNRTIIVEEEKQNAKSIPVLLYHGVMDKVESSDKTNISYENFTEQMISLKENGWQTINLEDFILFSQGKKDVPDKSFLLTFDDGRKDSYYPVDPILDSLNYNAVIFIITKYSMENKKSNFYLTIEELNKMNSSGRWEIESHTREGHDMYKIDQFGKQGNFYSNKLWLKELNRIENDDEFIERIKTDFVSAKNDVEQKLGNKVLAFAYPFGDYGQQSINFPESEKIISDNIGLVYPVSFYQVQQNSGTSFNYPDKNQSFIKRIEVGDAWNASILLKVLDVSEEKNIPFVDNFDDYKGWQKTWGQMSLKDNSMILDSYSSTTGSSVFLDGSYLWKNYYSKANIDFVKGQTFSLIARYKDDNNYTSCVFTPEYLRIVNVKNGEKTLALDKKGEWGFVSQNKNVGIKVENNFVGCYIDDQLILEAEDLGNNIPEQGGIGFGTWDPEINNSEMIIKNIIVEEIK